MRQLVEDGDADLVLELGRVLERLDERQSVDRHLGRQKRLRLEQPEEVGILRVLVLDDDGDVLKRGGELGRSASSARRT